MVKLDNAAIKEPPKIRDDNFSLEGEIAKNMEEDVK